MVPNQRARRVVVGVSDTPDAGQTLTWALAEAVASRRHLVVAHSCAPDSPLAGPGGSKASMLELFQPDLARAIAAAKLRLGGDRVSVVVRPDPPGELLVELARPSDLIVVGAPARPGWLLRETTTHAVLRHAPCPVIAVRPRPKGGPFASFEGTVIVGVDGSPAARAALAFAFEYAAEHRRTLVAANITARLDYDLWYDDHFLETHLTEEPASLDLLAVEVEPWELKYPSVHVRRAVLAASPVEGLVRASHGAALLVVGDHGGGRLRRAILGSVSEAAMNRADCPVAVVRAVLVEADAHV